MHFSRGMWAGFVADRRYRGRRYLLSHDILEPRQLLAAFTAVPVPTAGANPAGITAGPDGAIWCAETGADKVGRIPAGSPPTVVQYDLAAGSKPTGIVTGPDGNVWVTLAGTSQIAQLTPPPVGVTAFATATPG